MKYNCNLTNRGDDPYTDDVKAEIIALVCETGNFSEAAREMTNDYHERSPSPELIGYWLKKHSSDNFGAPSGKRQEAIVDRLEELILLTTDRWNRRK